MNFIYCFCFEVCNDFDNIFCFFLVNLKNCGFFFFICFDQMKVNVSRLLSVEEIFLKYVFMLILKCNGIYIFLEFCGLFL